MRLPVYKQGSLTKHQQSVHMGTKYTCEDCDNKFTDKGNLTKHQKSVHMGKKYPCEECGYQATLLIFLEWGRQIEPPT